MASRSDSAGSARPRSRRSIAHVPRSRLTSTSDKENATTDLLSSQPELGLPKFGGKDKKSRSKSLGPGGLDALQNSNGNRRKSTTAFPLKSILKPTVPVSPVRNIPTFEETRRRTPARGSQFDDSNGVSGNRGTEDLLIDLGTPAQPPNSSAEPNNPFDGFNAASIRDDIAAARERDEKDRRERERKAILEQREARRKSMANRRVSFAPEATLHTWNVVEIPDDSTSSSASNSTRRASSLNSDNRDKQTPEQTEPPSSPAESDIAFSPVQYPDLQQLTNRPNYGNHDAFGNAQQMSSSPFSGSSADGSEDIGLQEAAEDEDDDDNSSASGFDGESTAMSLDDMTAHSAMTARSEGSESTSSSARLNEALRQAAREAGTRSVDDDDDGDMSMEIAEQEITGAFQPWIKKGERQSFDWEDISARHDQENAYPTNKSAEDAVTPEEASDNGDEDLSMEVTSAIGGIITKPASRRQSAIRRKSSGAETNYDDQTMELTNVVGGIAQGISPAKSVDADNNADEDEEMTMEFTSVVGGVLGKTTQQSTQEDYHGAAGVSTQESNGQSFSETNEDDDMEEGADMEMTGAVGGILPPDEQPDEPQDEDQTAVMEVTAAIGKILPSEVEARSPEEDAGGMEVEPDIDQPGSSPFRDTAGQSPAKSPVPFHVTTVASESGSPSLASVRSRLTRQSLGHEESSTPISTTPKVTPSKNTLTPPAQLTPPQGDRSTTPGRTPPSSAKDFRNASPKKLFQPELQASVHKSKSPGRKSLFGNSATGESTPLFVLQPKTKRRSSGLGIDREGLGSPKVAAMLDKRRSIGEDASEFTPQGPRQQGVRFEDPVKLQEEVDREREEEESREDGHIPGPQLDATASLRDMISSLTPKKNKIGSRKSLHVGAARGLLGKRPLELDLPDDESDHTPKRLRGREASPVKNIRLPAPPSKDETVGHLGRSPARRSVDKSPAKISTTPTQESKNGSAALDSEEIEPNSSNNTASEPTEGTPAKQGNSGPEVEPIQLQEFLNMTNIHFMELTTTKRRHTTAPDSATKRRARLSSEQERSSASKFDDCVAAGFCTVPMLELYQHSCRELKSYISEGRQVIRSIETETYAENPPLFREYMSAAPDIRLLMDNQFRNVKTHARLLSKATWYEWRMKLLEGLKDGLVRHVEEMKGDDERLSKHEALLNGVVPALAEKHSSLEEQATSLQQLVDEIENCDQDELREARGKLSSIEEEIALKKQQLDELQAEAQEKTNIIEAGTELKAEYVAQIQEAEKVKEDCRGWSATEISELKESVHKIERRTGWSIVSATSTGAPAGPLVTLSYRDQLQLSFHPGAFINGTNDQQTSAEERTPIELKYRPQDGLMSSKKASQLSPIAMLVLKSLNNELAITKQRETHPKQILRFVAQAWDLTLKLEEEARMLEFCGVTKLRFSEVESTPSLRARCTLLEVPSKKTKNSSARRIDVDFAVKTRIQKGDAGQIGTLDFETDVIASKVYGFGTGSSTGISESEMRKILRKELGEQQLGNGVWSKAVHTLTAKIF
ncbi:hypothetical protein BDV25DRAFT_3511 [Aspergillus avenaceus]|uniref:Spc7 kinetochore protein domain-containing protein n=1 Tax=Aspergillus avenaceus TaxID=36643 RepID=A0A5N6TSU4_ASPAV|nr:hypothetical protein BDV25DRAFT_3511 [Aspergillus avenaceus]